MSKWVNEMKNHELALLLLTPDMYSYSLSFQLAATVRVMATRQQQAVRWTAWIMDASLISEISTSL